jgi:hypothetical protein
MAEYIPPGNLKKAAPAALIDDAVLRRDLYHLAAVFMASRDINALALDEKLGRVTELWNEFHEEEICLRLSSTAVLLRTRDDYVGRLLEEQGGRQPWADELRKEPCGTLQPDVTKDRIIPLKLREACNKVLHTIEYRFDVEGDGPDRYINPVVYLYGTERNGQAWRVVLDVLRYVELGALYARV